MLHKIRNHLASPPLAAITTNQTKDEGGNTLILVWRGSCTFMDWMLNLQVDLNAACDKKYPGTKYIVQNAYSKVIKNQFHKKHKDIIRILKTGDKNIKRSMPEDKNNSVKRIILTGHSLGGGLAQVAHVYMTSSENEKIRNVIEEQVGKNIYTVSFSAPMSISSSNNQNSDVSHQETPLNMVNFVYNMDPVPRLYAGLDFMDQMKEKIKAENKNNPWVNTFLNFCEKLTNSNRQLLEQYCHTGKIFYYDNKQVKRGWFDNDVKYCKPRLLNNDGLKQIKYAVSDKPDQEVMINEHIHTIQPGFGWT